MNEVRLAVALEYVNQFNRNAVKIALFTDGTWVCLDKENKPIPLTEDFNNGYFSHLMDLALPGTFSMVQE